MLGCETECPRAPAMKCGTCFKKGSKPNFPKAPKINVLLGKGLKTEVPLFPIPFDRGLGTYLGASPAVSAAVNGRIPRTRPSPESHIGEDRR